MVIQKAPDHRVIRRDPSRQPPAPHIRSGHRLQLSQRTFPLHDSKQDQSQQGSRMVGSTSSPSILRLKTSPFQTPQHLPNLKDPPLTRSNQTLPQTFIAHENPSWRRILKMPLGLSLVSLAPSLALPLAHPTKQPQLTARVDPNHLPFNFFFHHPLFSNPLRLLPTPFKSRLLRHPLKPAGHSQPLRARFSPKVRKPEEPGLSSWRSRHA